jgi:heterodisulfide reductase subunit A
MTGVFACSCAKAFPTKAAAAGLKAQSGVGYAEAVKDLCSAEGRAAIVAKAREHGIDRIVLAGCAAIERAGLPAYIAAEAGLPTPHAAFVLLKEGTDTAAAAPDIRRSVAALQAMPGFETRRWKLRQDVLVIGAGPAGIEAARSLAGLGHPVTMIDRAGAVPTGLQPGIDVLPSTTLAGFDGFPGSFTARLRGPAGVEERAFGAVVVATGLELVDPAKPPFVAGKIVPLPALSTYLAGRRLRELPKSLAIVLDLEIDEGKASCDGAYRAAVEALRTYRASVTLLVRDAKVAALDLNQAYDDAREAGVAVIKFAGTPRMRAGRDGAGGVAIVARDSVTGADVTLSCDLVAISPWGLRSPADAKLAEVLGLDLDAHARFQDNSSRLLPAETNRQGVFVVGACRGETWLPAVIRDACVAALEAHALLAPRTATVDTAHAVVDGDKCILCLTCVRSCPFKAMGIDAADRKADCRTEMCRRCGICAGECPNKAITLPAWSDPIVLGLAAPTARAEAKA